MRPLPLDGPRARLALLLVAAIAAAPRSAFGQEPVYTPPDVQIEGGPLSAWTLSVEGSQQVLLDGEVFESLARGRGGSLAVGAHFDERYALRLRGGVTRNGEQNKDYDDRTTVLEGRLEVRWLWHVRGAELEAGPTVGYARVSRPVYELPVNGFLLGGGVGAGKPIGSGFVLTVRLHGDLSSFQRPAIAGPAPPGFQSDAVGQRITVGLGLAYVWSR